MQIEVGILLASITVGLSIMAYFVGTKKQSKDDGQQRGYFEGRVEAKLDELGSKIDKLEKVYIHVDDKLIEHERRYHHG